MSWFNFCIVLEENNVFLNDSRFKILIDLFLECRDSLTLGNLPLPSIVFKASVRLSRHLESHIVCGGHGGLVFSLQFIDKANFFKKFHKLYF